MEEIEALEKSIKYANEKYRNGDSVMEDYLYDNMVSKLKELDPENDWFKHIEPVNVPQRRKAHLPVPMKSLNKVKSISELIKWANSLGLNENIEVVVMPKFDGLSLLVNEKTDEAFSRGGSDNDGQDCTPHYRSAFKISKVKLEHSKSKYTYGEFLITRKDWQDEFAGKVSPYTNTVFKSPRNTAAGLLNRDEPCQHILHASFVRYGIDEASLVNFDKFSEVLDYLDTSFSQEKTYNKMTLGQINENILKEIFITSNKKYPCDGVVVYINDLRLWEKIGRHETTGNPIYAIAYKSPEFSDSFETTVKGINWEISKSGALKPVVKIDAVDTGDCNMENPTGYNARWIQSHKIAKGAEIIVTRSGGVIPKILSVTKEADENELAAMQESLKVCPKCGSPLHFDSKGIELVCSNPDCSGIKLAKIIFFYNIVGAENMGPETIEKIYNAGFDSVSKMLNITSSELLKIDGFGLGLTNIILDNNKKIKSGVEVTTLMQASDCFCGIGKVKAKNVLNNIGKENVNGFMTRGKMNCPYNSPEEFKNLSKTEQSFWTGIEPFFDFISETKIPILEMEDNTVSDGSLSDKQFCISGFRDSEFENVITSRGGSIKNGVSRNTDALIVKDKSSHSSKIEKAIELNVPIFDISEFYKEFITLKGENS